MCTRMEITFVSVLILMVLAIVQCESKKPKYSTKTGYDLAFNENNILKRELLWHELAKEFSPDLSTCKPAGLYVVYRHGTRYPSVKDIKKFNTFTERVKNETINPEFHYLKNETLMSLDLQRALSGSGKLELKHLAKRLKKRFPSLFKDQFHLRDYAFQSTNLSRTIDSTLSFIEGFVDDDASCSSTLAREELSVSCTGASSSKDETVVVSYENKMADYLLRFFDAYEDCLEEQDDGDEGEPESTETKREDEKFLEGKEVADMQQRISEKLSIPGGSDKFNISRDEAIELAKLCGYHLALFNQCAWCDLLTDEDLRVFNYKQDLKHYWKRGYGHPVNYLVGCNLARDIISYFTQLTTDGHNKAPKSVFKFAHAETVTPLQCLLDLYKDKHPLTAATYQENQSRQFRTSWMAPFAANVALVLFNCTNNEDKNRTDPAKFKLQVFINEIPVKLPFCPSDQSCSFVEFSHHIKRVIGRCSFNSTCCVPSIGNCDGCIPFQFDEWNVFCICCVAVAFAAWMLILVIEVTNRYRGSGTRRTLEEKNIPLLKIIDEWDTCLI